MIRKTSILLSFILAFLIGFQEFYMPVLALERQTTERTEEVPEKETEIITTASHRFKSLSVYSPTSARHFVFFAATFKVVPSVFASLYTSPRFVLLRVLRY